MLVEGKVEGFYLLFGLYDNVNVKAILSLSLGFLVFPNFISATFLKETLLKSSNN